MADLNCIVVTPEATALETAAESARARARSLGFDRLTIATRQLTELPKDVHALQNRARGHRVQERTGPTIPRASGSPQVYQIRAGSRSIWEAIECLEDSRCGHQEAAGLS